MQSALFSKAGLTTWAGPALCEGFGALEPDDIMVDCFFDLVNRRGEGVGWRVQNGVVSIEIENAVLWGGNLTVLCSLVGTPFFPKIENGILFLEDIAEHPYRVERQLTHLLHAGVLSSQQAVVLGQFTEFKLTTHDKGFKLKSVVDWIRTKIDIPVLTGLPYGHVPTKVLLPFGRRVDLSVSKREALIVWGDL
jgi:muramoyltetrapeptide carboxypeptidase